MRTVPLLLLVLAVLATPAAARTRAIGAPGAAPTWTPADKQAFGTSATRESRVWFTLREREMTEVYFPDLGTPSLRSLEFVVARPGPEMAVDRETAHATGVVERLEGLNFRQTVTGPESRWRLTKTYTTDPFRSTVLVHVRFESLTGEPYRLHVLLDPQLSNDGRDDRSRTISGALVASDRRMASALAASPAFTATSSGYASTSDPWSDLRDDGSLDAEADARQRGNVRQAATTTLDGVQQQEVTLALGFGASQVTARRAAADALAAGFAPLAAENAAGWARHRATLKPAPAAAAPVLAAYETSLLMLAAHSDKANPGAAIASPSMPWAWGRERRFVPLPPRPAARPLRARHRRDRRRGDRGRRRPAGLPAEGAGPGRWPSVVSRGPRPVAVERLPHGRPGAADRARLAAPAVRRLHLARAAPHRRVHRPPRAEDRARPLGQAYRLLAGRDRGPDRRARVRGRHRPPQRRGGRRRALRARRRRLGRGRRALDRDLERPVLRRPVLPAAEPWTGGPTAAPATTSARGASTSARS